jgi:hypothetical protein
MLDADIEKTPDPLPVWTFGLDEPLGVMLFVKQGFPGIICPMLSPFC